MEHVTINWFWIGTLGLFAGTTLPLYRLVTSRRHRTEYAVLAAITGIAALAYLAMALGIGRLSVDGTPLYVPRYVDWLSTTPLLLVYLGLLSRPDRKTLGTLVGLDVVMMGSGVVGGLLAEPLNWIAYLAGVGAYLGVLSLLLRTLPATGPSTADRLAAVFTKLRNLVVVLWSIYPVVWLLGPFGLGLLADNTEVLVFTYLDLISKVGFVVIAVNGADALEYVRDGEPLGYADTSTA